MPISFALTAPIAACIGARATLVAAGLIGGSVTALGPFIPRIRAVSLPPAAYAPIS